ncbi:MAG: hypothetical protein R2710_04470 [Acidimicrobiales bacterium]
MKPSVIRATRTSAGLGFVEGLFALTGFEFGSDRGFFDPVLEVLEPLTQMLGFVLAGVRWEWGHVVISVRSGSIGSQYGG